ncbi:hypothetical protein [Escherichia coli]|uniref:hypothetical protein n=1 Tax=Escherichia coli TaxID=562 RepID=UPI001482BE15|nr:hypothetical protein [Escherichia coli]MBC0234889.1 hypothetical protein [Escherichia coli]
MSSPEYYGVPDGRRSEKGGVAGNPGCVTKMDNAAEGLAYGKHPVNSHGAITGVMAGRIQSAGWR